MTDSTNRPTHSVSFSRVIGTDDQGQDRLGPARQIGAIWPRSNGKKGGILRYDHIPSEMIRHQGVVFIVPVEDAQGA